MTEQSLYTKIRDIIKAELEDADFEWDGEVMFCGDSNRGFDLDKITDEIEKLVK